MILSESTIKMRKAPYDLPGTGKDIDGLADIAKVEDGFEGAFRDTLCCHDCEGGWRSVNTCNVASWVP